MVFWASSNHRIWGTKQKTGWHRDARIPACYGLNCTPQNSYVAALTFRTSECDCIWRWLFKEVKKVPWGHWGGLLPGDWCPCKKRSGHRRHRGTAMWGLREKVAVYTPKSEASPETHAAHILIAGFWSPELWENQCLWVKPPSPYLWYFAKAAGAKQCTNQLLCDLGQLALCTSLRLRDGTCARRSFDSSGSQVIASDGLPHVAGNHFYNCHPRKISSSLSFE